MRDREAAGTEGRRTIILVDDNPLTLRGLVTSIMLRHEHWRILEAVDEEETRAKLASLGSEWPDLISVDLGLRGDPNGYSKGLEIVQFLAREFSTVPLVAHSALNVSAAVIRQLLSVKASYVRLTDDGAADDYVALLPFMMSEYLILSPGVRSRVPDSVVVVPDPLEPWEWQTCKRLAQGWTYAQVAAEDQRLKEDSMESRVATIIDKLVAAEIMNRPKKSAQHNKQAAIDFYNSHGARYGR